MILSELVVGLIVHTHECLSPPPRFVFPRFSHQINPPLLYSLLYRSHFIHFFLTPLRTRSYFFPEFPFLSFHLSSTGSNSIQISSLISITPFPYWNNPFSGSACTANRMSIILRRIIHTLTHFSKSPTSSRSIPYFKDIYQRSEQTTNTGASAISCENSRIKTHLIWLDRPL